MSFMSSPSYYIILAIYIKLRQNAFPYFLMTKVSSLNSYLNYNKDYLMESNFFLFLEDIDFSVGSYKLYC